MNSNTVRVDFDDEKLSVEEIVTALAKAGYAVPGFKKTN
jgi:copper chaperone CopZ